MRTNIKKICYAKKLKVQKNDHVRKSAIFKKNWHKTEEKQKQNIFSQDN